MNTVEILSHASTSKRMKTDMHSTEYYFNTVQNSTKYYFNTVQNLTEYYFNTVQNSSGRLEEWGGTDSLH
jgi:hypothetical protein